MSAALQLQQPAHGNSFNMVMEVGQEDMWRALRDIPTLRRGFAAQDLARVSGAPLSKAEYYLARLAREGIAKRQGLSTERHCIYSIEKMLQAPVVLDERGHPSRDYALRTALWKTIRIRKAFSARLIWLDVRDTVSVTLNTVEDFIERLAAATYLLPLDGPGRFGEAEFTLRRAMDTGPLPPRLCEAALIYDPNRRVFYGTGEAHEVRL